MVLIASVIMLGYPVLDPFIHLGQHHRDPAFHVITLPYITINNGQSTKVLGTPEQFI